MTITRVSQVFEAELGHQRISPEQAVPTVTFLTRGTPATRSEGFVTVESARMLAAKTLAQAAETVCFTDAELLLPAAHEIAPDEVPEPAMPAFPYVNANGDTVWACCTSAIGQPCQHKTLAVRKIVPGEVQAPEGGN